MGNAAGELGSCGPAGRGRWLAAVMTSTGQEACSATFALTEPSKSPAKPPWPRLPTTSMIAPTLASSRTLAAPPSSTCRRRSAGGYHRRTARTVSSRTFSMSWPGFDSPPTRGPIHTTTGTPRRSRRQAARRRSRRGGHPTAVPAANAVIRPRRRQSCPRRYQGLQSWPAPRIDQIHYPNDHWAEPPPDIPDTSVSGLPGRSAQVVRISVPPALPLSPSTCAWAVASLRARVWAAFTRSPDVAAPRSATILCRPCRPPAAQLSPCARLEVELCLIRP